MPRKVIELGDAASDERAEGGLLEMVGLADQATETITECWAVCE